MEERTLDLTSKNFMPWGHLTTIPIWKHFLRALGNLDNAWGQKNKVFQYKPCFIFSQLKPERKNILKGTFGFRSYVIKWKEKNSIWLPSIQMDAQLCYGLRVFPIISELLKKRNCMPRGSGRKLMPSLDSTICIPLRALWWFPWGHLLCWQVLHRQQNGVPSCSQEHSFSIHSLLSMLVKKAQRIPKIKECTIIADNVCIFFDDFKPDKNIIRKLFKNVLVCHISLSIIKQKIQW